LPGRSLDSTVKRVTTTIENSSHALAGFLTELDHIKEAADRLQGDPRDQFAVALLLRFEELDAACPGPLSGYKSAAIRDSLRRVTRRLLEHHAGSSADPLHAELVVLSALTMEGSVTPSGGRSRKLLILAALLVGGLVGAVSMLPGNRALRNDLSVAVESVENLEKRVAQVANDKAREQDAKESASAAAEELSAMAEELAAIAAYAAEINADLEICIEYGDMAVDVALDLAEGYTYDSRDLDRFTSEWSRACRQARQKAAELRTYLAAP